MHILVTENSASIDQGLEMNGNASLSFNEKNNFGHSRIPHHLSAVNEDSHLLKMEEMSELGRRDGACHYRG